MSEAGPIIELDIIGARGEGILDVTRRLALGGASENASDGAAATALATYEAGLVGAGVIVDAVAARDAAESFADAAEASADNAAASAALAGAAAWNRPVLDRVKTPPTSPASGDRYLIHRLGTTGSFVGHENEVAEWNGAAWVYSGAPKAGQILSVRGILIQYRLGLEEEAVAGSYFWRRLIGARIPLNQGGTMYSSGDSITVVPDATNCWPNRLAKRWGLTLVNSGVSGTGTWKATAAAFAWPTGDVALGNNVYFYASGHNPCVQTVTANLSKLVSTTKHEIKALILKLMGDHYPAGNAIFTYTGSWSLDSADAAGLKPLSYLNGGGGLKSSTAVGAKVSFSFDAESLFVHTVRGDGVSANRNCDVTVVVAGSTRTSITDDGLVDSSANDGSHAGHAVYMDNLWGAGGPFAAELSAGSNCGVSRPFYFDGITVLRPASECNWLVIALPLRPTDLTPTSALSAGQATSETFRAFEDAVLEAVAMFPGYPIAIYDPNLYIDAPGDFSDSEHPSGSATIKYLRAIEDMAEPGTFQGGATYTPVAGAEANCATPVFYNVKYKALGGRSWLFSGEVDVDPTTADALDTNTNDLGFTMSLPWAVDITSAADISGVAATYTGKPQTLAIRGNATDNAAWFLGHPTSDASKRYTFSFVLTIP